MINVLALLLVQKILPGKQVILNTSTSSGVIYLHLFHTSNEIWWTKTVPVRKLKMNMKDADQIKIEMKHIHSRFSIGKYMCIYINYRYTNSTRRWPIWRPRELLCLNNITHWQTSDKLKFVFANWTAICNGSPVVNAGKAEPGITYEIEVKELIAP